jgi:hypothetical protein
MPNYSEHPINELVILRMGPLMSPPHLVPYGTPEWRIGVPVSPSLASEDSIQAPGPTERAFVFRQKNPEYLVIGESSYRVLDFAG